MQKYKILITDGLDKKGLAVLHKMAKVNDCNGISADELITIIPDYDALIVRSRTKVTSSVFQAGSKLKAIGRAGVGVDNIDLDAAKTHGVTVVNAPISTSLAVAELTIGLMLALAREIPRADAGMKQGDWLKKDIKGVELNNKFLGILGMGRIGTEVGKRSAAFGMRNLGFDPFIPSDEIARRGAEPVSLDEMYTRADYITLHLPFTEETRSMLGEQAFGRMKRGVRVLCAARGGIIDEPALLAALESGQVAGAALDVFASEPPGAAGLVAHPRLIATPHIGAQTAEAQVRAAEDIANEILAVLNGEPLRWKIV